jgi:hypothetical protein
MALFPFGKKKKDDKPKISARERAAAEHGARRQQALETGFVEHPEVEREYRRQRFLIAHERKIRAGIFLGIATFILIILGIIALVIYRNIPGRDDDNDGVLNVEDVCPGFDDRADKDSDGVPDGCEEVPPFTELEVAQTSIIPSGQDRYDVAVQVRNPNTEWGASPLEYQLHLIAADGSIINSTDRTRGYILPSQTKYLVGFNLLSVQTPARVEIAVSFIDWLKVQNYEQPAFETSTVVFEAINQPGAFSRLKGKTVNHTTFTFDDIQITILLRDAAGAIVGVNRSEIDTLTPGEGRDFIVTFPEEIPGVVTANIVYETDVDVFSNETFVSTSVVRGQRFQQFTPQSE